MWAAWEHQAWGLQRGGWKIITSIFLHKYFTLMTCVMNCDDSDIYESWQCLFIRRTKRVATSGFFVSGQRGN